MESRDLTEANKKNFLALGDSYTLGEGVHRSECWPAQLVRRLANRGIFFSAPRIIARTGWRTDELMDGITSANLEDKYDLVSLSIGVNNQYQNKPLEKYAVEFDVLLQRAIRLADGKREHVFVLSIPDYGYTPFGNQKQEQISTAINQFNKASKGITKSLDITYIEITDITRAGLEQPDLITMDDLHPSGKMYSLWVDRIMDKMSFDILK